MQFKYVENSLKGYLLYQDVNSRIMSVLKLLLACLHVYIWVYIVFRVEKIIILKYC